MAQACSAFVELCGRDEGTAECVERADLGAAVADRSRHVERLARDVGRVAILALEHPRLRDETEQRCALGTRLVVQTREPSPRTSMSAGGP